MRKLLTIVLPVLIALAPAGWVSAGQTILKAYAPAGSDGTRIILEVDWAQVQAANPEVTQVLLRRRTADPLSAKDTVALLAADSARIIDGGLDPETAYRYYAYFKNADGETLRFGSVPAVVYLGPIYSRPRR